VAFFSFLSSLLYILDNTMFLRAIKRNPVGHRYFNSTRIQQKTTEKVIFLDEQALAALGADSLADL
jgi:hypothetical protein